MISGWYAARSRRTRIAVWLLFVAWLVIGVATFPRWSEVIRPGRQSTPAPSTGRLLLIVVRGPEGAPGALALVHGGATRDIVLLPTGTLVEVPGIGPEPMRTALAERGHDVLAVSVANALGTQVPEVLLGGAGEVSALVDALGGVAVDVPEPIDVLEDGFERTLFRAGPDRMDGSRFASFLTLTTGEHNELERVARQNAAWRGLFAGLRGAGAPRALAAWTGSTSADSTTLLQAVAADEQLVIHTLPVTRVGVSQEDLYRIADDDLGPVRLALADVSPAPAGRASRVRLLLGADEDPAAAVAAARLLVDNGYTIVLTGRAGQTYDVTRVVMVEKGDAVRKTAGRLIALLGTGRLGIDTRATSLFDVTLVIGSDWAQARGFRDAPDRNP